jgi:hypothetical protein
MSIIQSRNIPAPITRGKELSEIRIAKNDAPYLYTSLECKFDEIGQRAIRSAFIFQSNRGVYTHCIMLKMLRSAWRQSKSDQSDYKLVSENETYHIRVNLKTGTVYHKLHPRLTAPMEYFPFPTGMNHLEFKDSMIALAQIADEEIALYQADVEAARLSANLDKFIKALAIR